MWSRLRKLKKKKRLAIKIAAQSMKNTDKFSPRIASFNKILSVTTITNMYFLFLTKTSNLGFTRQRGLGRQNLNMCISLEAILVAAHTGGFWTYLPSSLELDMDFKSVMSG